MRMTGLIDLIHVIIGWLVVRYVTPTSHHVQHAFWSKYAHQLTNPSSQPPPLLFFFFSRQSSLIFNVSASASAHLSKPGRARSTPHRRAVSGSSTASTPRPSLFRFQTSTSSPSATPPPALAILLRPGSAQQPLEEEEDVVGPGGFDDDDVAISQDSVVGRPRGRQPEVR